MQILSFSGSPREIGRAFGETCSEQIKEFYALRIRNAIGQALQHGGRDVGEEQVLKVARACVAPTQSYHPEGFEEMQGIAEGSGLPVEKILAMNGLTDIRDVLAWGGELEEFGGCSSFIVQGDYSRDGKLWCGQTWDLATDNMPFVIGVHRKPTDAPESWTLTTVGCLSLIGINDAGLSIGTTNIRTTDSRPGVTYLNIIHKVLSSRDFETARKAVIDAPKAGAHYYYVCDKHGRAAGFECSPGHVDERELTRVTTFTATTASPPRIRRSRATLLPPPHTPAKPVSRT